MAAAHPAQDIQEDQMAAAHLGQDIPEDQEDPMVEVHLAQVIQGDKMEGDHLARDTKVGQMVVGHQDQDIQEVDQMGGVLPEPATVDIKAAQMVQGQEGQMEGDHQALATAAIKEGQTGLVQEDQMVEDRLGPAIADTLADLADLTVVDLLALATVAILVPLVKANSGGALNLVDTHLWEVPMSQVLVVAAEVGTMAAGLQLTWRRISKRGGGLLPGLRRVTWT